MPKKVFELAAEISIGPLDLVENLKAKGFIVRNHMTLLSDEDVQKYLELLQEEQPKETVIRKSVTRKKDGSEKLITIQSKPLSANPQPALTFKMGDLKVVQAKNKKDFQEKIQKLEATPIGRREIIKNYSKETYRELELVPFTIVKELFELENTTHYRKLRSCETGHIDFSSFSEERKTQVQKIAKTEIASWELRSSELAIGAEIYGNEWAIKNGLLVDEISTKDNFNKIDAIIGKKRIDYKTRQRVLIGKKQNDLPSNRWDKEEVILFIQASAYDYNHPSGTYTIIGVFDGSFVKKYGFAKRIEACSFFTAPFFVDARFYFKIDPLPDTFPRMPIDDIDHYFKNQDYCKVVNRYGGEQYFKAVSTRFKKFEKLAIRISDLYSAKAYALAPLAIFDAILDHLERNVILTKEDCKILESAFLNCIELNKIQKDYLLALLTVASEINQRLCRFTGNPLNKATIRFIDGIMYASFDSHAKLRNTLLAYSRYSGELLYIGASKVEICQDVGKNKTCACLVHMPKDRYIGKSFCPDFGT